MAKILLVDDEIELKNVLVETLSQAHEAHGCTSGREALGVLRVERFDLLITDLMMPGIGGLALIKEALEIDPRLVTIIMTGQGTTQSSEQADALGAFAYLLKPFSMRTLHSVISGALDSRKLEEKAANYAA